MSEGDGSEETEQPQGGEDIDSEEVGSGPRYSEEDLPPAGAGSLTPSFLVEVRESPIQRRIILVVVALAGLALAWFHWAGLFVAGALVGLVSKTVPRAVVAGIAVGVIVLAVHVFGSPVMSPDEFLTLSPPSYVTVAAGLLMPLWGSLVRGVI